MTRRRLSALLIPAVLALAVAACAGKVGAPAHEETVVPKDTTTVYVVEGDVTLTGRLFGGENKTVVILSHMRQTDETAWFPFAEQLAEQGYAALTFNFRGYDGSTGSQDYGELDDDLRAVIDYVRGARNNPKIFLVGASMGATTSLVVAQDEDIAGVVAVSPPAQFDAQDALKAVPGLTLPKLFIASERDSPALDFDDLVEAAAGPKQEEVYPGNLHGTDLLDASKNANAAAVGQRILAFLSDQGGP